MTTLRSRLYSAHFTDKTTELRSRIVIGQWLPKGGPQTSNSGNLTGELVRNTNSQPHAIPTESELRGRVGTSSLRFNKSSRCPNACSSLGTTDIRDKSMGLWSEGDLSAST